MERLAKVAQLPFGYHLTAGIFIRLFLIAYADYHDSISDVKYTDVDYKVFTDAARYVALGESPFNRHTYRYSPIIAWLLVPNVVLHESFGKLLFCSFDIMIAVLINAYIQRQFRGKVNAAKIARYCSMFWLYNPLPIVVSSRGNADSVSCFFILMSLFFLNSPNKSLLMYMLSGTFLGISIHMRLYPIFFSFPMYLSLGDYKINRNTSLRNGLVWFIPNKKQITLALTTAIYFFALTYGMFLLYGFQFMFETYIYHFTRKDIRHNFSLYFYYAYLSFDSLSFDLVKYTSHTLVLVLLFLSSVAFGCDPQTLPFALFLQTAVLVTYNSVTTSQYFLWYLSLLPLVVQDFRAGRKDAMYLIMMWTGSQLSWLFYAYLLEFQNQEVYIILFGMCLFFFGSNITVLYQLINLYCPGYGFGMVHPAPRAKSK